MSKYKSLLCFVISIAFFSSCKTRQYAKNNKQIEKIEQEKAAVKEKIQDVDSQRENLKARVESEQKNASEEQKKKFWSDYLKKD